MQPERVRFNAPTHPEGVGVTLDGSEAYLSLALTLE